MLRARRTLQLTGGVLAALLLAGCTGDDPEPVEPLGEPAVDLDEGADDGSDDERDDEDEGDAEDHQAEIDEYAIPEDPDELGPAYVDAVLDRMHEGLAPAMRESMVAGEMTDELREAFSKVYVGDALDLQLEGWQILLDGEMDGTEISQPREDLEPRTHRSTPRLISDECIVGPVEVDESPWYDYQSPPNSYGVALARGEPDPPVNPTPWRIAGEGFQEDDLSWCQ